MSNNKWLKYLPLALIVAVVIAALVGGLLLKNLFGKDDVQQKKMVQQITVMTPPPPPPPPPPEQVQEPEVEEPQEIEEPTDAPPEDSAEPPAGQDLGVDAEGGAGGDAFGLVGKKGGRGLLSGGGGYEQLARQELNEMVLEHTRLKHMDYVAVITLVIAENGEFERYDVDIVSGDPAVGDILRGALKERRKLSKPRPLEAASTVKLRIKSVL